MNKHRALSNMAQSRQYLLETIQCLSEDEIMTQKADGSWTVKDIISHLQSWENALLLPLKALVEGKDFIPEDIPDHNAWNDLQASRWQAVGFTEAMQSLDRTRQEILALVEALPEDQWTAILPAPWGGECTLAQMLDGLAWHENLHNQNILQAFDNPCG